jgi:hypothetical protein
VTIFEFFARPAGTWIITAWELILNNRGAWLLCTGVVLGCSLLITIDELLLANLLL